MALATLTSGSYSVKPLPEKLGYQTGQKIAFVGLPDELSGLPSSTEFGKVAKRQSWARPIGSDYDVIHAFTRSREEMVAGLPRLRRAVKSEGMIWVSWPKKSAKVPTDLTEDVVRDEALKFDLVDVKVAAVDNVWSALKLVLKVDRR
jgi:hypothetical protein